MIIDTSALIAILRVENDASEMALAIERAPARRISAANYLETAVVIDASRDPIASRRFDELVDAAELRVEPVTHDQARIARDAYRDFGKGSGHKAGLQLRRLLRVRPGEVHRRSAAVQRERLQPYRYHTRIARCGRLSCGRLI